jgi:copper chaperone|tara:strand:- start:271 stop:480 length:210 start_codon:yes stop_codon:yes gene_type:complete
MAKKYRVLGMACDGCAQSVTKALKAVAPDATIEIEVDLETKEVSVEGLSEDAAVQQAVEGAGFEYGGLV